MSVRRNVLVENTTASDNKGREIVKQAFANASQMMKESGYGIKSSVEVAVDPQLPFMGYTMPRNRGYRIVVSGGSVDSGLLEGLLVHEMSHIYRMENNHPSHDAEVIEDAIGKIGRHLPEEYQQKIVHDILNDIQDLYADDISMKVLKKSQVFKSGQMSNFLQDWVKDEVVETGDQKRDNWVNASILVHNARAIGQMTRHQVEDTDVRAAEANKRFLSQMSPKLAGQFPVFRDLMINLKENVTRDQYRELLSGYLDRFLEIAEKN